MVHVYITKIPEQLVYAPVFPKERQQEIDRAKTDRVKKQKYMVWRLLQYSLEECLGLSEDQFKNLDFRKEDSGKWTCACCSFSLTHTTDYAAAAIASRPVGIDAEHLIEFRRKHENRPVFLESMAEKIILPGELRPEEPDALLRLWTKKEAAFKLEDCRRYLPDTIDTKEYYYEEKLVDGCALVQVCTREKTTVEWHDISPSDVISI